MAFKTFHQIKEANAEIQRLASELDTAQAALNKATTDHATALLDKENTHKAAIDAKDAKIKELEGSVTKISGDRDTHKAAVDAKDAKIKDLEASAKTVETRAAEIASTIGAKEPVAVGTPAATAEDPRAKMQAAWSRNFVKR